MVEHSSIFVPHELSSLRKGVYFLKELIIFKMHKFSKTRL